MKDYDMTTVPIKSKDLKNDISIIKNQIILKNQIIVPDDGNYTFGFIIEKDTLFADNSLEFWRYKNKGMASKISETSKRIILKEYKLPPNQQ
ncbi:hypothetical protein MQX03_09285 [Chryseobacterium aahli]|uniref:hypothetical protein n=1 Tax=Chryseobacterium aahli TaxID=1278643 RepID=UPI001F61F243|nr:hypothetical protein [Chryseobacterium aahli]MCI3937394.1 hypothetical protein [Chryseobacterium aahli]